LIVSITSENLRTINFVSGRVNFTVTPTGKKLFCLGAIQGDRCRSPGIRCEPRELRPADQLPEVPIKAHQVLTEVNRRSGKPCIGHGVSLELLVNAELPQTRPFRAERCQVYTSSRKQCIDKGHGVLDGSRFPEDLGATYLRERRVNADGRLDQP
jgi:hypothetical protein